MIQIARRTRELIAGVVLFIMTSPSFAQLVTELPVGRGSIGIRNDTEREGKVHTLDFQSVTGDLVPAPIVSITGFDGEPRLVGNPGSFTFMLANNPNQVTYGNLGSSVSFPPESCTLLITAGVHRALS